ncbi:MAG: hypothetical protein RL693_2516 [Verrucomicrobiota bacterium]
MPPDGLHLEGKLPVAVFELDQDDNTKPVSPLEYSLDVDKDDDDILISGSISATFDLECGRCAERFLLRLEQPDYQHEIPIENEELIDLTIPLREDMLLALPTYPRCEMGNISPRKCPAEGKFDQQEQSSDELPEVEDKKVWEALDQLNNLKRN